MDDNHERAADENAVRDLVEDWARAVRPRDMKAVRANHSPNIVMFDVPSPLESLGIDAHRQTWEGFFSWAGNPVVFDFSKMEVTAGGNVAHVVALMRCAGAVKGGERLKLEFRLTMGPRKIKGQWIIEHEHHSIPAN